MPLSEYAKDHPIAIGLSSGALILGVMLTLAPVLTHGSAAFEVLPPWAVVVWALWYGLGGLFSLIGLIGSRRKFEAAGMALLASALTVSFLSSIVARGVGAALAGIFLLTLAGGCAARSALLVKGR